jgi:hypothetical protein
MKQTIVSAFTAVSTLLISYFCHHALAITKAVIESAVVSGNMDVKMICCLKSGRKQSI